MVEAAALHQRVERLNEVVSHCAAKAAILEDCELALPCQILFANNEVIIDANLTKFILNDCNLAAVLLRQYVVDQCGLAGAQEACHHLHVLLQNILMSSGVNLETLRTHTAC